MKGTKKITSEAEFVELYADVEVGQPPATMPLSQALQLEALLCPAPDSRRLDPSLRLGKLAEMVGASLLPEHRYLLPANE